MYNIGVYVGFSLLIISFVFTSMLLFLNGGIANKIAKIYYFDCKNFDQVTMDKEHYFTKGLVKLLNNSPGNAGVTQVINKSPPNVGKNPSRFIKSYAYDQSPTRKVINSPSPSPIVPKLILNENDFKIDLECAEVGQADVVIVVSPRTVQNNYIQEADDQISEIRVITEEKPSCVPVRVTLQDYRSLNIKELHYDKRSFWNYFRDEIIVHHRLLSIFFKTSLLNPIHLRVNKLIFEFSMTFALSAILFNDTYIDNRAKDSQNVRHKFIR
jgi:hypothetical protein